MPLDEATIHQPWNTRPPGRMTALARWRKAPRESIGGIRAKTGQYRRLGGHGRLWRGPLVAIVCLGVRSAVLRCDLANASGHPMGEIITRIELENATDRGKCHLAPVIDW